jgi:sialate O-acetylesterase
MMRTLLPFLFLAASLAPAQSVQVTRGAVPYQVFQRDASNRASIHLEGSSDGRATEARVVAAGRTVAGFDWRQLTSGSQKKWSGDLNGVPTGGPYRIELRAQGGSVTASVDNVLVGDLWVLAGQSNMEGVGNLENTPLPSVLVNSFDQTDVWVAAADPLHQLPDAIDPVHWGKNAQGQVERLAGPALDEWIANRKKGAGVGLPFALEMVRRTGVPIGLLPCAHGGTSMDQWSPALKDKGGDSLYGAMIRRLKLAGGHVAGLLWYQGEDDASPDAEPKFAQKFKDLIAAVRTDFGRPDLPFYYVQIGRHVTSEGAAEWNQVQQDQLTVEAQVPHVGMVTCADCCLDDGIHVSTKDHVVLGRRLANLACHDLFPDQAGCGTLQSGPRPVSARMDGRRILVEFKGVNGHLRSAGRLNGFAIVDASGKVVPTIYSQRVSETNPSVVELLFGDEKLPDTPMLGYGIGFGRDMYVNLSDDAGMAAPVFGPMPIQR